jgi:hypothetical protein
MARAIGVTPPLVLPVPPEKYDVQDQRELRQLLQKQSVLIPDFSAIASIPTPVTALGGVTGAADTVPYFTGLSTMALAALTPYARTVLACASAAALKTVIGAIVEADMSLSDVTTLNVATTRHGFAPKLPNDATKYLDGTGNYTVPVASAVLPSFPAISNLELRLSAQLSTIAYGSDGLVTSVSDLSGNGRTATNGSSGGKPRYFPKRFANGRPCFWFDGNNFQHLVVTMPNIATPCCVVIVVEELAVGTGDGNLYRDQTARAVGFLQSGNTWSIFGTSGSAVASSALWNQNHDRVPTNGPSALPAVRIDQYDGANSLISNNGTEVTGTIGGTGTFIGGTLNIGNGATTVTTAAKFLMYEFLIFSKALSPTERAQINAYYRDACVIPM